MALCAILLLGQINAKGQILYSNGTFEGWPSGCPYNTAPNNWQNYSTNLGPDQAGTCAGTLVSHGGSSHMNLVWINSGTQEGASQVVAGLTPGTQYRISFWGTNGKGLYSAGGDCIIDLHINSQAVFSTGNLVSGNPWTEYTYEYTATAATATIGFRVKAGNNSGPGSGSAAVDDFSVTNAVAIEDELAAILAVYPNPVQDQLLISIGDMPFESGICAVTNLVGQTMIEAPVNFQQGIAALDLQTLDRGIYFVQLTLGDQLLVRKIVVE